MRKILFICIMICSYLHNSDVFFKIVKSYDDWNYAYSYAIIKNNERIAERIADCIIKYSKENELDPRIVTRKLWRETKIRQHAVSYGLEVLSNNSKVITNRYPIAYGLSQVHLKVHLKKLYFVFDKKYAKRLHKDFNFRFKMIFFIGVNIKLGTDILRDYLDKFDGDYYTALHAYWAGPGSDEFKDFKNGITNQYAIDIMEDDYDKKMAKWNDWKFIEKKRNKYKTFFTRNDNGKKKDNRI